MERGRSRMMFDDVKYRVTTCILFLDLGSGRVIRLDRSQQTLILFFVMQDHGRVWAIRFQTIVKMKLKGNSKALVIGFSKGRWGVAQANAGTLLKPCPQ